MQPNDLLAQQQQMLDQAMQNAHNAQITAFAISIAGCLIGAFVTYLFYARLRGIEGELRKFRIAYEFAHTPQPPSAPRHQS